jgi:hypothetical protein
LQAGGQRFLGLFPAGITSLPIPQDFALRFSEFSGDVCFGFFFFLPLILARLPRLLFFIGTKEFLNPAWLGRRIEFFSLRIFCDGKPHHQKASKED